MAGGVKLSNLAAIPFSQLDDEDIFYVVDVSNGTETYVSNRISLADLRRAIISGATAGIVAKPIIYELTDNAGTPVLPQGVTYASLLEDLTEKEAIVELNYLDKVFQVSLISNLRIEFSNVDPENIYVIRITNANVVSLESFDFDTKISGATTYAKELSDALEESKQDNITIPENSGLIMTVTGSTLSADIATVAQTLNGDPTSHLIDADGLKGAMSLGQAVDVSCQPVPPTWQANYMNQISVDDGENWIDSSSEDYAKVGLPLNTFRIKRTGGTTAMAAYVYGWQSNDFPKFASDLKYLLIMDCKNLSSSSTKVNILAGGRTWYDVPSDRYVRVYLIVTTARPYFAIQCVSAVSSFEVEIKNWRQYEVTNLTDEAIQYLASAETNPDPDKLFRSSDFFDVSVGYMIKSDMVNPWSYLIPMSTNSPAMTVGSGLAYQLSLTDGKEHEITVDTFPTNAYGQDAHIQLLLANNSTVVFKSPLNLIDALIPNAANNITVKFRAGQANVYLDDTDTGYVVTVTAGTEFGSLYDAITVSTDAYIIFATSTDSIEITTEPFTVNRICNIIGNGSDNTIISGSTLSIYNASYSNITFKSLESNDANVILTGNLSNCVIDDCGAAYHGVYRLEKGRKCINTIFKNNRNTTFCIFVYAAGGGSTTPEITNCTFINNAENRNIAVYDSHSLKLTGSTISECKSALLLNNSSNPWCVIKDCTFGDYANGKDNNISVGTTARAIFSGTNKLNSYVIGTGMSCFVNGCILDLTDSNVPYGLIISSTAFSDFNTASVTGSTIKVVVSDALDAVVGGTATVLYKGVDVITGSTVTISNTISGGGAGYIMRNNGAMGVPVITTSLGQAGSFDTLIADSSVKQITFAPVIDNSTISLAADYVFNYGGGSDNMKCINGPGADKITISGGTFGGVLGDASTFNWVSACGVTFSDTKFTATRFIYVNDVVFTNTDDVYTSSTNAASIVVGDSANPSLMKNCIIRACKSSYSTHGIVDATAGSVVDSCLFDSNSYYSVFQNAGSSTIKNCKFTGLNRSIDIACFVYGALNNRIENCFFDNRTNPLNSINYYGDNRYVGGGTFDSCTFSTNNTLSVANNKFIRLSNCTLGTGTQIYRAILADPAFVRFANTNHLNGTTLSTGITAEFEDGAVLDLKLNSNEYVAQDCPIVVPDGATVTIIPYGATQASQYITITGPKTGTYIKNTGENDLA